MSAILDRLRARARREPDAMAVRGDAQHVSYGQLLDAARRVADSLQRQRIGVLAVAADNSPDWVVLDFAAQIAGTTLVPVPLFFSKEQIRHVIVDSGADALAVDRAAEQVGIAAGAQRVDSLTAALGLWRTRPAAGRALPPGTAKISYTSGTTGTPKGVCLSQALLDSVAASLARVTASAEIRTHLCLLPLATLLENVAGIYAPIEHGATISIPRMSKVGLSGATGLDARRLIECLESAQPHSIILLPQMLAAFVATIEHGARAPASLRFVAVGGGLVAPALLERADRLGLPVFEGYGLTECASVVALNTPQARRIGSVGRPLPHVEIRVDANSEIVVRGAAMCGYLETAYRAGSMPVDEVATGDLGRVDADGFLHITGRRKNQFITSFGRNVQPDWAETGLTGTGSIVQAALFGEARPWNVAVVVPANASTSSTALEAAVATANSALPHYAQIHQWIRADEPFTLTNGLLTANGRNRRLAIWNRYRERVNACYDEQLSTCA